MNQVVEITLSDRYRAYALDLMAEVLKYYGSVLRDPGRAKGQLIITLERLISALREQPFHPVTEYERRIRERSLELLEIADRSVNGPDTNDGRAKLFVLVSELKTETH